MKIIRMKEVSRVTGLSRATIYRQMAKELFPASIALGENSIGWLETEVHGWIIARVEARDIAKLTA